MKLWRELFEVCKQFLKQFFRFILFFYFYHFHFFLLLANIPTVRGIFRYLFVLVCVICGAENVGRWWWKTDEKQYLNCQHCISKHYYHWSSPLNALKFRLNDSWIYFTIKFSITLYIFILNLSKISMIKFWKQKATFDTSS